MVVGHTYKSLEVPANYFGCHVSIALFVIVIPFAALLGFLFLNWLVALLTVLGSMALAATIFSIGAWLGTSDPFWVEAGQRHLLDEEPYLDV